MAIFSNRGIHYHVSEWGSRDRPPVVLLHGFAQSSETWEQVAEELSETHHVVAPDFVGHGRSDKPYEPTTYEMGAIVDTLTALLRWLWVDRVDLVGYSMGGRIALTYACMHPHHVASLVLESTSLGPKTDLQHQASLKRDLETIGKLAECDIETFMREWAEQTVFESQKHLPQKVREKLHKDRCTNDPRALALMVRGCGQHTMADFSRRIEVLPMPLLYIAGILDRRYLKIAEELQHNSGISCVLLNTGHNTHLEAPEVFSRRVKKFLDESSSLSIAGKWLV